MQSDELLAEVRRRLLISKAMLAPTASSQSTHIARGNPNWTSRASQQGSFFECPRCSYARHVPDSAAPAARLWCNMAFKRRGLRCDLRLTAEQWRALPSLLPDAARQRIESVERRFADASERLTAEDAACRERSNELIAEIRHAAFVS